MGNPETPHSVGQKTDAGPGEDRALDPRSVTAGRIKGAILVAGVSFPTFVLVSLATLTSPWNAGQRIGLVLAWIGGIGLLALTAYVRPDLRYRYTRYRVDDRGLTIRRGVWWRSVTSVPKSRVQHTDVLQGPLQRQFELATLVVHTAGTQNASVWLSGLAHQVALPLRDFLLATDETDGV